MNDFNLEQYLKDKGWSEVIKKDIYGQTLNPYIKKITRDTKERIFEFEIHGECKFRPDATYCKILEKGIYSIYYVMFEGAIKSYTEVDVIFNCLGLTE
jgi:hypothetical protein